MAKKEKETKIKRNEAGGRYEKKVKLWVTSGFADPGGPWTNTGKRLLMAYNGKYHRNYARRHRYTVNTIFSLVQLLLPNLLFQQPYIRVTPTNAKYFKEMPDGSLKEMDATTSAQIREASLNHRLKKINAVSELQAALVDAFFWGFGICKAGYSYNTASDMDTDYVVQDTCFLKRINPVDFGRHPLATKMDDSPFFSHRLYLTKDYVAKKYGVKDEVLEKMESCVPQHIKDRLEQSSKDRGKFSVADVAEEYVSIVELHDLEKDTIQMVSGDGQIFLTDAKKNPYKFNGPHFTMVKLAGDNERFEGIPLLATIEDQALMINELLTLMIEHIRKFPAQLFVQKGSVDEGDIERIRSGEQGSIHVIPDVNGLKPVSPVPMGNDYYTILRMLQDIVDRTLGIPDFQRGISASRQSATEASLIHGDASARREYYLQIVKDFVLASVKRISWLDQQYQDKKEEIRASGINGGDPITYDRTDIQGDYAFDFDISSLRASNEMQMNAMTNLLSVLGKVPTTEPILASINPFKLGASLFRWANLNYEALKWNPGDPQFQQVMGMIADRMMQAGASAMGQGPTMPAQAGIPTMTPGAMPGAPGEAPTQG